jgi:hypothetical protein
MSPLSVIFALLLVAFAATVGTALPLLGALLERRRE